MAERLDIHNEEQLSKITDLNNCNTEWLKNAQTVAIYLGKDWGPEYCKLERAYIAGRYENANIWHDLRKNPDDLPPKEEGYESMSIRVVDDNDRIIIYDYNSERWRDLEGDSLGLQPDWWCALPHKG